jgi:hypothetical protein
MIVKGVILEDKKYHLEIKFYLHLYLSPYFVEQNVLPFASSFDYSF